MIVLFTSGMGILFILGSIVNSLEHATGRIDVGGVCWWLGTCSSGCFLWFSSSLKGFVLFELHTWFPYGSLGIPAWFPVCF